MKLFYSKGSCSLAVRITIHEMDVSCDYELVDIRNKLLSSGEDFLKINPHGTVPVLQLDSGEILTENAAIQIYLAEKYKAVNLLPAVGEMQRYRVLEWLSYVSTELHKSCGPLFNPTIPADLKATIFKPILEKKLAGLDPLFAKHEFLVGNHYTLPDSYLFVVLTWMAHFDISLSQWPHLDRYFNQIKQRASVQKSLAEGG